MENLPKKMFRADLLTSEATLRVRGKWEFIRPANWSNIDSEICSGRIFDSEDEEILSVERKPCVTIESLLDAILSWIAHQRHGELTEEKICQLKDQLARVINPEFLKELQGEKFDPKHWFEDERQRKTLSTLFATVMTFSGVGFALSCTAGAKDKPKDEQQEEPKEEPKEE